MKKQKNTPHSNAKLSHIKHSNTKVSHIKLSSTKSSNIKQQKYKITLEYNGNCFFGWQYQKNRFSVQEALMIAGSKFSNMPVTVYGSSRTDVGVHATYQVCHMILRQAQPYQVVMGLNFHLNQLLQEKKKTMMSVCKNLYKICEYDMQNPQGNTLVKKSGSESENPSGNPSKDESGNISENPSKNILKNPTDNTKYNPTDNKPYNMLYNTTENNQLQQNYADSMPPSNPHSTPLLNPLSNSLLNLSAIKENLSSKLQQHFGDLTNLLRITQFHNPIVIKYAEPVNDDFHARFNAKKRKYVYKICNRQNPTAIHDGFTWWVKDKLSINAMKKACELFIGTHDFKYFRSVNCQSKTTKKTIDECKIVIRDSENIEIHIESRSFLHNQVRLMVAAIKKIGAVCAKNCVKNCAKSCENNRKNSCENSYIKTDTDIESPEIELANANYIERNIEANCTHTVPTETNYMQTNYSKKERQKHHIHNANLACQHNNENQCNPECQKEPKDHKHNQKDQQESTYNEQHSPYWQNNAVNHLQHIPPCQQYSTQHEQNDQNHLSRQENSDFPAQFPVQNNHVYQNESTHPHYSTAQFSNSCLNSFPFICHVNSCTCCHSNECKKMLQMLENALNGQYDKKDGTEEFKLSIAPANALYLTEVIY